MSQGGSIPSCRNCHAALVNARFVERNGAEYCLPCFEDRFANTCVKCKQRITAVSKDVSFNNWHWHEACFTCSQCQRSLANSSFFEKDGAILCGDCHGPSSAGQCYQCGGVFSSGQKRMQYNDRSYHENCFACMSCMTPIGAASFVPKDGGVLCMACYERMHATRCAKCNGPINTSAVVYNNMQYHRECLTCNSCNKQLAGIQFTTNEGLVYCIDCHTRLFAKRCFKCQNAITGGQFTTYGDQNYHQTCFNCSVCGTNLAGKSFLTSRGRIICQNPACAV